MSAPVLLQSPVGRMPTSARWYLAGISMLALLLVAVHFALQVTAQQQARNYAAAWAAQSGASFKSVRLRMLRGAMTIQGVHWQGTGIAVTMPFLLLRGHFTASAGASRLTEVQFRHADIRIEASFDRHRQKLPAWLAPMLDSVRKVTGDGELYLAARGDGLPRLPLHLHNFHYSLHGHGETRKWQAWATLFGGKIGVYGDRQQTAWQVHGVDAGAAEQALGLAVTPGQLAGSWQLQAQEQRGELELQLPDDDESGRLAWHGRLENNQWRVDLHSRHWPLAMTAPFAPALGERSLVAGFLDAALHLQLNSKGWNAQLAEGDIQGLAFTSVQSSDRQSGLYIRHLHLVDAQLNWPQRAVQAKRMQLQDVSLALAAGGGGSLLGGWQLACDDIAVERLLPGMQAGDSMFWLPDVSGQMSLAGNGEMTLVLATAAEKEEQWRLQGQGLLSSKKGAQAVVRIEGEHVPFVRFRPLLGARLAEGREMEGAFSWNGEWRIGGDAKDASWRFAAEVVGEHASMLLDGQRWGAARIEASLVQAKPGGSPHFSHITADKWFCRTAIQPMRDVKGVEQEQRQPFWLGNWQVDELKLRNGSVSVGNADAHWLTEASATLAPIEPGKSIAAHLQGVLGEGRLKADGDWYPWGALPHLGGRATLRHALPFVLHDWLHLSGLPRLIRGRISADLKVKDEGPLYRGSLDIELAHAALEGGAFGDDPLPDRIGYRAIDLFERLGAAGRAKLKVPLAGRWSERPLSWTVLADALLEALRHKAEGARVRSMRQRPRLTLSHIRLQQGSGLRHNERVRLRSVIAYLKKHRDRVAELTPQIGNLPLDATLVERVRRTQRNIESFMVERGIGHDRIVPVWPTEVQRRGEATGIRIQAVM